MKFEVYITGEFNNIKGMRIAQKYLMNTECGACHTLHPNSVYIGDDQSRMVKIPEKPKRMEKHNLVVKCRGCDGEMKIDITEPEDGMLFEEDLYIHPIINGRCHVSTLESDEAVVKKIDTGLILDLVSNQDKVFKNVSFDKRTLAEDDKEGHTVEVVNLNVEVKQVK